MTSMFEVKTVWSGFTGSPGYTQHYFIHSDPPSDGAQAAVDNVRGFWFATRSWLPNAAQLQVQGEVRVIEDTDGSLVDIIGVTAPAVVGGNSGAAYAAVAGWLVSWGTATVHGSHRVRGRTFGVPGAGDAYQTDGTLLGTAVTGINDAATALRTATGPTFCIWSRPRAASAGPPPVTARAGLACPVTSNVVPDRTSELRSRRD